MNIGNIVNWFTTHQGEITAGVATSVLVWHTVAKGWKDAQEANKDKTGLDKTISCVLGTISYIFSGTRA